jgi:hypothetical protein
MFVSLCILPFITWGIIGLGFIKIITCIPKLQKRIALLKDGKNRTK